MSVLEHERRVYADAFAIDAYSQHSPGEHHVALFRDMAGLTESGVPSRHTVLDAGTGSGKGALALKAAGFQVRTCDLDDFRLDEAKDLPFARVCLWHPLISVGYAFGGKFDYVYCTDVLEHIPPEHTMLSVSRLLDVARHGLFLSISLVPDAFGAWVGQPLHQTVRSFAWWRDNLNTIGTVVEGRDLLHTGIYWVTPR